MEGVLQRKLIWFKKYCFNKNSDNLILMTVYLIFHHLYITKLANIVFIKNLDVVVLTTVHLLLHLLKCRSLSVHLTYLVHATNFLL